MPALLPFPNPNSIPHSELPPRRTGKVARLPKAIRDRINHMLDENLPYHTIIAELGEAGQDLNPQNLSNWAQGGYQDYLRHQDLLDALKDQLEFAKDLLAQVPDPGAIFHALRLMAGLQLSRVLFETGQKLAETDPAAYSRLVRTICSLSAAERQYCQDRNRQAQAQPAPAKPIDYFRPLTERETQLIKAKLDEMCGYSAEPAPAIKPDQASAHPVGTSSTSSPTTLAVAPVSAIKPDQASGVVAATVSAAGEGSFQPPVPVPSASSSIKADQASTQPVGTSSTSSPTLPAIGSVSPSKPDQTTGETLPGAASVSLAFAGEEVQGEKAPSTQIKASRASAQNSAATTSLGHDAPSLEFKVQSSTFAAPGSRTQLAT